MCGIAGVATWDPTAGPPDRDALVRMVSMLRHRGPDEFGFYRDQRIGLAHSRLSIIDLATGQQPLTNEDGSIWITFNGEIFNFIELRDELSGLGHRFATRSDTEVIVHAWEQWGARCFARFNGQWALALWDAREEKLILSRDPLGILPLFYAEAGKRVVFASEVKAIFAGAPEIPRRIDPVGLAQTFTFWSTVPPQSVFQGIRELEPGCTRIYSRTGALQQAHFEQRFPSESDRFKGTLEEATEHLHAVLDRATALRVTRSDVPVGSYLSGGLDSSLLAAMGRRHAGSRFSTFSLRFGDSEYDETRYQRQVADLLSTDHRELMVTREDIASAFPSVVWHAERPFLRTAAVPMFLLSRMVRQGGTKVVLSGEGADEMFAGYDLFREGRVRRFWAKHPGSKVRPRLLERLYPYLTRSPVAQAAMARQFFGKNLNQSRDPGFAHEPRWRATSALQRFWGTSVKEALLNRDVAREFLSALPTTLGTLSPLAQDQYIENCTLLSGYLLPVQSDRVLMANSVEGRFPFLDPEVMSLANSLPDSFKLQGLDEKHVLKRVSQGMIPGEIIRRVKQPYRAPDALSFTGSRIPSWVDDLLSPEVTRQIQIFQPEMVDHLRRKLREFGDDRQFSNSDNMAVVGVLSTHFLHRLFVSEWTVQTVDVTAKVRVDHVGKAGS